MNTNIFTPDPLGLRMTYGKRLQKAMTSANKSRKQLAAELQCTVQAIGMVVTGGGKLERALSAENNVKAARFLKVDSFWLATGDGNMQPSSASAKNASDKLSEDALDLAVYFDKLTDPGDRTMAYVAAMAAILKVLAEREAKNAAPAIEAPAAIATPKKQDA